MRKKYKILIFEKIEQQEITSRENMSRKDNKKRGNWTNKETLLFVEMLIDEKFNFVDCLERGALKRSANEEVYKEI